MASACVNNNISMSPEIFPAATYGWLGPRVSFSREEDAKATVPKPQPPPPKVPDLEPSVGDFEFRLEDPMTMLPADELFSGGKLVPLQLSSPKPSAGALISPGIESPDVDKSRRRAEMSSVDPFLFSPKAPRCSSRWRELLGLKMYQNSSTATANQKNSESLRTATLCSSSNLNTKSLKNLLHRSSKSSTSSSSSDASLVLPLLKDSDCESLSISSSRLSHSSSSSGHEHDELPRLSFESDKVAPNPFKDPSPNQPRMRLVKPTTTKSASRVGRSPMRRAPTEPGEGASRGVSVDSPRMKPSGKIVFQSLERSSSSPSSLNGGPRFKHRGMERSYSANVRVTPVLNVPVCSLKSGSVFGFGQLFSSPQKNSNGGGSSRTHHHQHNTNSSRNRTDRI